MTDMTTTAPIRLSIVIPAFNEAENVPIVIQDSVAALDGSDLKGRYELLLIDDGSSDDTPRIADEMARRYPCVRVFHHERNLGMGEALKTGYRNSRGVYVTFIAGDGEIKADQALKLYHQIGDADMMTSTRLGYVDEKTIRQRSLFRGVLTWGFQLCARVILGCDTRRLTGISLFRGSIVRSLSLHSHTSLCNLEILLYCLHTGAKMRHGEITICPRLSGSSKIARMSGVWNQLWEMIKLRGQIRHHVRQQPVTEGHQSRAA
jgi:glycosyltransferase involved in cell wall biosynthesis